MSTSTRSNGKGKRVLTCTLCLDGTDYPLSPLPADPDVAERAFRLEKQAGEFEVYDVRVQAQGLECDCRGFVAHGRCKHVEALGLLGLTPAAVELTARPVQAAEPPPKYRSTGDMAANAPEEYAAQFGPCDEPEPWADYPPSPPWTAEDYERFEREMGAA